MNKNPCGLVLTVLVLVAIQPLFGAELHLHAIAVSDTGKPLAKGTYKLATAEELHPNPPSTTGRSSEPAAMYLLLSYVGAPTPSLLSRVLDQDNWADSELAGVVLDETGDWNVKARTTIDHTDILMVPGGTFTNVLRLKTVLTDARSESSSAARFIEGTRWLWLARGVGLVRMRYEHSSGQVTEAALLSHSAPGGLRLGNHWTYAWKNDLRQEAVIESWSLAPLPQNLSSPLPSPSPSPHSPFQEADSDTIPLDLSKDAHVKIPATPAKGFHFPYFLLVPKSTDAAAGARLLVEPNNTGSVSDEFQVHEAAAARLLGSSYATQIARKLGSPLLVPVFPRPASQWQAYTHSLDEDTLRIHEAPLKRIDLQLIQMVRDAQALLRRHGMKVPDRVFMHGYSASGVFANRFAALHPSLVRAVASGGVNAIPLLPCASWSGTTLPYPVGIADLEELAGTGFDLERYRQVSQFIYMGYLDRNDTTLSRDAFSEDHAKLIRDLIGAEMPIRWQTSQSIYRHLAIPAQCVTYHGTSHEIKPEMIDDIVRFFRANSKDDCFTPIQPHEYPFVQFQEIREARINAVYWPGDERIPTGIRNVFTDQNQFILGIREWMNGQDHVQLNTLQEKAVFRFLLRASGHETISITRDHLRGNCSSGHGEFQGFFVNLSPSELNKISPGVAYEIIPVEQRDDYLWKVEPGVTLVRQ